MKQFQINKKDFSKTRIVEVQGDTLEPGEGEILARVERFGFSANNITYAVAGDTLGYWQFFLPIGDETEGWGVLPVWGFAEIIKSDLEDLPVGERLFGYFPPADEFVMRPEKITRRSLFDAAPHRAELPPTYNNYQRVAAEPGYERAGDNHRMLLWPLYATSFALWDFLKEQDWFGAERIALISASSKTAIGLAYGLAAEASGPKVVGLTSSSNAEFVSSLGIYDEVVSYHDLETGLADLPTAMVDFSGNADVLDRLYAHLGSRMMRNVRVGLTHWEDTGGNHSRENSAFFFAPAQMQKRMKEWGAGEFMARSGAYVTDAITRSDSWLSLEPLEGLEGLSTVYDDVLNGKYPPDQGLVIKL